MTFSNVTQYTREKVALNKTTHHLQPAPRFAVITPPYIGESVVMPSLFPRKTVQIADVEHCVPILFKQSMKWT